MSKNEYIKLLQSGSKETFEALKTGKIEVTSGQNQLFYNPKTIRCDVWKIKGIKKPKIILDTICIKSAIEELLNDK